MICLHLGAKHLRGDIGANEGTYTLLEILKREGVDVRIAGALFTIFANISSEGMYAFSSFFIGLLLY